MEMKKLEFHTMGKNGKSKCVKMHMGKPNEFCPSLKVHGKPLNEVSEETYLGDLLCSDGKNIKNIGKEFQKELD